MKKLFSVAIILIVLQLSALAFSDDFQDGLDAATQGDFKTAFEKWKPLAKKGSALAQFNMGLMYDKGEGVKRNYKRICFVF